MPKVTAYHSLPKDLHAVLPKVSSRFNAQQKPGGKREPLLKSDYYMGPPWRLMLDDAKLFLQNCPYLLNICTPLWQKDGAGYPSGDLAELYPSWGNMWAMALHVFLIAIQSSFLFSLLFVAYLPFPVLLGYIGAFVAVNQLACWQLNGSFSGVGTMESTKFPECSQWKPHANEKWIYLNGVSVG